MDIRTVEQIKKLKISYIFCLPGCIGYGGLHRFYNGKIGTGILYFATLGGFGLFQVLDLLVMSSLTKKKKVAVVLEYLPHEIQQLNINIFYRSKVKSQIQSMEVYINVIERELKRITNNMKKIDNKAMFVVEALSGFVQGFGASIIQGTLSAALGLGGGFSVNTQLLHDVNSGFKGVGGATASRQRKLEYLKSVYQLFEMERELIKHVLLTANMLVSGNQDAVDKVKKKEDYYMTFKDLNSRIQKNQKISGGIMLSVYTTSVIFSIVSLAIGDEVVLETSFLISIVCFVLICFINYCFLDHEHKRISKLCSDNWLIDIEDSIRIVAQDINKMEYHKVMADIEQSFS